MNRRKVLVFPGSTEIGLEIWRALRVCKDIELYSAASSANHAPYVFKRHYTIPDVVSGEWLAPLNECIGRASIDYIYPANDDVLLALTTHRSSIGCEIVASPHRTCEIARFKSRTYDLLGDLVPVPRTFKDPDEVPKYPVFVKPDRGAGSQGASVAHDLDEAKVLCRKENMLIMEYLPGKEFTVDCLVDRRKGLLFCAGRERVRVKSGIAMHSRPVGPAIDATFRDYATKILSKLEMHGAWFFQVKQDSQGTFKLLEVAPRVSGTMATFRVLGVNFPLLSIYEMEGMDIEIMTNDLDVEIDRRLENRYLMDVRYTKVYVDLDDTIVINGSLNTQLITFLYQSIARGHKVVLITKNKEDPYEVLARWRIKDIFDDIIWLDEDDEKADHIDPKDSIFIDDSFGERRAVQQMHGIPTFSCDMVESLLDDRV